MSEKAFKSRNVWRTGLAGIHVLCLLSGFVQGEEPNAFSLKKGDVVVFAGGTNMLRLQQAGYLEAMLTREFATARPKFRDLSWEADTVFAQGTLVERWRRKGHGNLPGLGDLEGQLKRVGATVVIAQFGRLESMAGVEGLKRFIQTYEELITTWQKQTRSVVLVSPTPFERPASSLIPDVSAHNKSLAQYVKAIENLAGRRGLLFVDLFSNVPLRLTRNGLHIRDESQPTVAGLIAGQLGVDEAIDRDFEVLRQAVIEKHRLWYDYWRPANWKLLFGDDYQRQFTRGGERYIPFREEWQKLLPLIARAEERVWKIAGGGPDPGHNRPKPEVLHGDGAADVEKELAAFITTDGLQVNLFASEREGLTSPLSIRWDPAGRMYVTVTTTYPHVFPGDLPNDKVIVLEDSDRDGQADKSRVFADGLNIPTGLELGNGGVYVGQNTEILFLKDTDGDGRADERRVLLGGFGNGDSHQTINSFFWSPDGELFFGHGDGCESRVETPWGASNLFNAGFYRFRPGRLQLLPFLEGHMGPGNPWGIAFDEWGQVFNVDGAGGVNWLTPGLISTTHRRRFARIGDPGGYCGIGLLDGRHLPESLRGDFVTGDFKANRVKRFSVRHDGSGFKLDWKEPILRSTHRNFRPVDVKVGPDGAIYVVDWYNPITCHQDDAYRHPARDKAHGRIWRLSTALPTVKPGDLTKAPIEQVVDALRSEEHWTRYQAKRELTHRDRTQAATALDAWIRSLDPKQPRYEHHLVEALGAFATIEVVEPRFLKRVLDSSRFEARAFATRLVGRWHDRLEDPLQLLASQVADDHPLVRLEAVVACTMIPDPRSITVAAQVIDKPMNRWMDYAFRQAVHGLRPVWLPAFQRGEVSFARSTHLAAVLSESGGAEVLRALRQTVDLGELRGMARTSAIEVILAAGGSEDLMKYGLDRHGFTVGRKYDALGHARTLGSLIRVARFRDIRPAGDYASALSALMNDVDPSVRANAITLAGIWKVGACQEKTLLAAKNESSPVAIRRAAFEALVVMGSPEIEALLSTTAKQSKDIALQIAAVRSLAAIDKEKAARYAAMLLSQEGLKRQQTSRIFEALLTRDGGAQALAAALQSNRPEPERARQLLRTSYETGWSDFDVATALRESIGEVTLVPQYDSALVKRLAAESREVGNAVRGQAIFGKMVCSSCHRIGGRGGNIGPDLSAIGTTLSRERIIEELVWPNRQVKEGYSLVQVITNQGRVFRGHEQVTRDTRETGDLILKDPASGKLTTIRAEDIDQRRIVGSAMPEGQTTVLSQQHLLDLISYLSKLGQIR